MSEKQAVRASQPAPLALPSLRTRLLRNVLIPLLLTWLGGTALVVTVAHFFTERAFDRAMLDDAYLLASRVEELDGKPVLSMSPSDLRTVLFDRDETEYFAIQYPDGTLLVGQPGLKPPPRGGPDVEVQFVGLKLDGRELRGVVLERDEPVPLRIVVALTTRSRSELLNRLIVYAALPQLVLLLGLAVWLQRGIRRDLAPLSELQFNVEQRDAADLTPLPALPTRPGPTREVVALADSINDLLARVDDGVRAQREFAGNVAHELRTPLAGIRVAAEYGLAQDDPQRWREQLQAVHNGQQRASHLVDQLLALALADEAYNSRVLSPVDIGALAREVVLQFLTRADRAGVELGASGLDLGLSVPAHPALLEGLLSNLLDNALRYGKPADGGAATISVDLSMEPQGLCLSVTDNGPGIAPEQRATLRLRWAQGADSQRLGVGAGLGLSIVERYVELMEAQFILGSGPDGRGLRASVIFPPVRAS